MTRESRASAKGVCVCLATALVTMLQGGLATAAESGQTQESVAMGQENFWNVTINGADQKEATLFLRQGDGNVLVAAKDLDHWRLRLPKAPPVTFQGEAFFLLRQIEGLSYRVDETTQSIFLEVAAAQFEHTLINTSNSSPQPTIADFGGFLNYDFHAQYADGELRLHGLGELGVFSGWGVGTTTLLAQDLSREQALSRLDSTWTKDMPSTMTSLRFGDATSYPGEWGGSVRFGGIQWATNFATQPRFVPFPTLAVAGEAVVPSTVDVYVNNALRYRTDVPAGPFSITDLPVMNGQGNANIVVRDVLGREQVFSQPYYISPRLLSAGVHDFSYEAGLVRRNYGLNNFDYGRALLTGTHRYGFSKQFTGEAHGEFLREQQSLGFTASYLWSDVGVFSVALAGSHGAAGVGSLLTAGFQRQGQWFHVAAQTRLADANYTQLGLRPDQAAPREVSTVSLGLNFGQYGSLNVGYLHQDNRAGDDLAMAHASYNVSLGGLGALSVGYMRSLHGDANDSVSLSFTLPLGERSSASLSSSIQRGGEQGTLQIQQSLPRGSGLGYRLLASVGRTDRYSATVNYQTDMGLYNVEASRYGEQTGFRGSISGGIGLLGMRPFLSRRLTNSFARVRVPGIANVRVYADNQLAAVTDSNGDALIPHLRPYQRNPIRIEQADLPLEAQFTQLETEAVPYYRSGYDLPFAIKNQRGAILTLLLDDGQPLPSGSTVQIDGAGEEFPVAHKGQVYLTGLAEHSRIQAHWRDQTCDISVVFPETQDPLPDLGSFTCKGVVP